MNEELAWIDRYLLGEEKEEVTWSPTRSIHISWVRVDI
jgi:hypothetical protein